MYKLYGHLGSPYSIKMRSLMRYRQIPFQFKSRRIDWEYPYQQVKVKVIPILEYPDGKLQNDSTVLIYSLEQSHTERSVIPQLEADAFLALLIEDMADEWLSKSMYAYRWAHPAHTQWTGKLIAFDHLFCGDLSLPNIEKLGAEFAHRQVTRNALVGCTQDNMPLIQHIGDQVLDIMERHVVDHPFLFGSRPSIADFGIYGQISQFIIDLAAIEPSQQRAPYTMRWLHHMDDLSGCEGQWRQPAETYPAAVEALLALIGEQYLPFLLANEAAIASGADSVELSVSGFDYRQTPFKYQVKCLQQLRQAYSNLSDSARVELQPLLHRHNCLEALQG
ncbi:MAG: glutathione S-transferase N-terminal domain-containing protein [Porticoccaceae bacterium]